MTILFIMLAVLDSFLDGTLIDSGAVFIPFKGIIFLLLILIVIIFAQLELANLISNTGAKIFKPVTIISSVLLATGWYWSQFAGAESTHQISFQLLYTIFVLAFSFLFLMIYQARKYATENVIVNCGANCFSIFYLGLLTSFILGIRLDFSVQHFLLFTFTVKSADIGAYTVGRLFGKHKWSPAISPNKTIEGLIGAAIFSMVVGSILSICFGIMSWWLGLIFGLIFAFVGQLGDLAESMIKRDASTKDASDSVPGFGGVLDIVDSLLPAAPLAYIFFAAVGNF